MKARIAASIVLAATVALGTAGCTFITPQATTKHYDASDGVSATVGDVKVLDAIAILGKGDVANLVFTAYNSSDATIDLAIQFTAGTKRVSRTVSVAPGSNKIGYDSTGQLLFTKFTAKAGSLADIYFQYGSHQGEQAQVPVLTGNWSTYEQFVPSPAPTASATPNPIVTPAPVTAPVG